jgi:putative flavoprotein involved in K+ transport
VLCATRHWGVAMSEHRCAQGIPHVVLERRRIAERWRF